MDPYPGGLKTYGSYGSGTQHCCESTPPPPPHRDRYGRVLNLFMFRGKFNESIGLSLASLQPPTPPPADYVVPVVPEKPAPTPVAKKTAVVKLPGKVGAAKAGLGKTRV
jgi:hypothetical protein